MSFRFTSFSPTILDSAVTGPKSWTYFRIATDTPTVGFTVVHNMVNEPVIIIEWSKHPIIEIRDIMSTKRQTSRWLGMSPDKGALALDNDGEWENVRLGTRRGKKLSVFDWPWCPAADVFGDRAEVALEITAEAVQIGLLEMCIAATLLFKSGRTID
ncbi:hypothetical protein FB451DRAFT_1403387 [Mycena latifolia]|nr:hypothetical protein FB451DRAFT_1403387 [Mycena latifolia]